MNTVHLIQAYSAGSGGLVFRLRQRSGNAALARRVYEQEQAARARLRRPPRSR